MKDDLHKLKRIRDTIIGLEMQISLLRGDLDIIVRDLLHMYAVEEELIENIKVLKTDKIVAVASEYKRSIIELSSVRRKIDQWRNKELLLIRKLEIKEKSYEMNVLDFEVLKKRLEKKKVILLFDPSKRRKKREE